MKDRIISRKPLKKKLNCTKIALIISILSVIMITGVTLAWFHFQGGEDFELDIGKVELNTNVVLKENLATIVPGEMIIESSSFNKSNDAVNCYVRAVFEYHSESKNLSRDEKNYMLALNAYDYSANIATGVDGVNWLSTNDGYYYLVDDNNNLLEIDDDTTYTFVSNIILPSIHEVIREGLTIDRQIEGLKLKVKFQAIQSEYLPATELVDFIDIFNLCFEENVKDEFLVRFNTNGEYIIAPQIVKLNDKIVMPEITNDEGAVAKWYIDSELTEEFDFETPVKMGYMLYVDWVFEDPAFTPGLIMSENTVVGYVGNSTKVIVPSTYSLSGQKITIEKVANAFNEFLLNYLEIMNYDEIDYDIFPVTMTMAGESITFNNMDEFNMLMSSIDLLDIIYPVTTTFIVDEVIEGDDYQVTTIGASAFADMTLMVQMMSNGEFSCASRCEANVVVLPEGITHISNRAFAGQILYSMNIPSTVTTIDSMAFYQSMIYNLNIPSMITTIADDAFSEALIFECYNNSGINISEKGAALVAKTITNLNDSDIYTYNVGAYELYFLEIEGKLGLCGVSYNSGDCIIVPGDGTELKHLYSEKTKVLGDFTIIGEAFNGLYDIKYVVLSDNIVGVESNIINCINLEYVLAEDYTIANNISAMLDTYLLQDSGYGGLNFVETGIEDLFISNNTQGRKWVKYGNSNDGYSYYEKHELEISFSQGLIIENGIVVGYNGSDMQVIIPETYSLVTGKIRRSFMGYMEVNTMSDLSYPLTIYANGMVYQASTEQEFIQVLIPLIYSPNFNINETFNWEIEYFASIPVDGDDYTITGIGDNVFDNNENIVSVTIPSTVTSVPSYSLFYENKKLREIINLSSVDLSVNGVQTITNPNDSKIVNQNGYIFYNGGTDNIYLMGYQGKETELILPSSFNGSDYKLYHKAFAYNFYNDYMLNVTKITIPKCVTAIGESAFVRLINLKEFVYNAPNAIMEEIEFNYNTMFDDTGKDGFEVTIGANVTKIPVEFFKEANVSKINIPENSMLTEIGQSAFYNCVLLNSILIPSRVTTIGNSAFYGADSLIEVINLSSLTMEIGAESHGFVARHAINILTTNDSKIVDDGDYRYYNGGVGKTAIIKYNGNDSQITLPSQINGQSYFINARAFYGNKNLVNITIPNGVTGIGAYAFYECEYLQTITIPETITSIGFSAFAYCYRVTDIYYNARNIADLDSCMNIFGNVGSITENYGQTAKGVNVYIGVNVERIPNYMFSVNDDSSGTDDLTMHDVFVIENLIFAENSICTSIGANAFVRPYYSSEVTVHSIVLPSNITTIDVNAFGDVVKSSCYVLCENSMVAGVASASGFTKVYVRDTTTNFSSISFTSASYGCVDGIYTSGTTEYIRAYLTNYRYYTKYLNN